jgi:hypothetical protein
MNTLVIRLPIVDTSAIRLDQRIKDLCAVEEGAGYRLVGFTTVGSDLLFIFQPMTVATHGTV